MADFPPTSRAFADAVHHYRQLRDLSLDELAYVLSQLGHGLTTADLRRIEHWERAATVDNLIAIAAALGVRPAILLSLRIMSRVSRMHLPGSGRCGDCRGTDLLAVFGSQ
ncbi:helix-turn-helix transcriptional regulator [Brevibacterium sp. 'Marine']|uniref:helix-turn-helix domain-containing protein n=1 Tax=Brevibacterium sp. 'Marine' TaxID=2725563 RepID=UPI00145F5418|nr:helix-turn-helix transcriptional regulator [Brevibacterium sp. 'Marine']